MAYFQLFHIFYVYAESGDYLLLGTAQSLEHPDLQPNQIVRGWLPRHRLTEWNTREALEWDHASTVGGPKRKRKEPGLVWDSADGGATWTVVS